MKTEQFACPRCTKPLTKTSHWHWKCAHCDILFEWVRAVWKAVEKGVS